MRDKILKIFNKKTIYYVESIAYISSIIIVVFANVFGPIWIRMIPLLFLLGIIGKLVFDRPVVTTVFGSIVSVCTIYLSGVTNILENIIASGIFTLYIALGEWCGSKISIIYKYLLLEKKTKEKKKEYTKSLIFAVCIIIFCTLFHNYTDSNIFMYQYSKNRLVKYLDNTYAGRRFEIVNSKYNYISENNFEFIVECSDTGDNYKFIVYVNKSLSIYDGIRESDKIKEKIQISNKINLDLKDKYENIDISINQITEGYELNLLRNVESLDNTKLLEFSKEVSEIINLLISNEKINNFINVNISLIDKNNMTNSKITTIYLSGYINNKQEALQQDYMYIMKALNIEYIG